MKEKEPLMKPAEAAEMLCTHHGTRGLKGPWKMADVSH